LLSKGARSAKKYWGGDVDLGLSEGGKRLRQQCYWVALLQPEIAAKGLSLLKEANTRRALAGM
jgi:hypothetical protein